MEESLAGSPKALSMTNESRLQLAEALQKEVEAFFVVPNLLWAMWSMAQSVSTKITFGYWVTNKDTIVEKEKSNFCVSFSDVCRGTDAVLFSFQRVV